MKAKDVKRIVIHCTAGFGDVDAIKNYWHKVLKWRTGGYHIIIDLNGNIKIIYPFSKVVNGVRFFNSNSIHISYIGGVEKDNYKKAKDTRTPEQKEGILKAIKLAKDWINVKGGDANNVTVLGHRDLSPDKNNNGIIETWERIKECPSFDAIPEYNEK